MNGPIYVKDGEDISIIATLSPTVGDPSGEYPAVAQTFRVIANSFGPTLTLVPLRSDVTRLTNEMFRPESK
jgi:hypothetical protein